MTPSTNNGRSQPSPAVLPEWPSEAIAILATADGAPHAIPVSAPVRAGDRRILITLGRMRGSLGRLRGHPEVALVLLAQGNLAFTARGRARVVAEHLNANPGFAGVAIEVEHIDDHRAHAFEVYRGIVRRWLNADAERDLGACIQELRELADVLR
jgi:hypothetical protein